MLPDQRRHAIADDGQTRDGRADLLLVLRFAHLLDDDGGDRCGRPAFDAEMPKA